MTAKNGKSGGQRSPRSDLYDTPGFVVLRAPLLPVEFYQSLCKSFNRDSSLLELLENHQVRLAIETASPSLVSALLSPTKSERDLLRARRKLRRYLIRMSTRPTPFGAFAGVAIVPLGDRTTLRIDETGTRFRRRLDIPWLLEFVHQVESDPDMFRQLNLQANPCTLARGGRVYVRQLTPLSEQEGSSLSLKGSRLVGRTLASARLPTTYENLVAVLGTSPQANEDKIRHFIRELWRQGVLLTDLRPPLTDGDPAQYVLRRLNSLQGNEPYRMQLQTALAKAAGDALSGPFSESGTNGGVRTHVDSLLSVGGELNGAVAKEAARAAELLLSFTPWPGGLPHLRSYRQSFEDRYGVDREIPLVELLDPEYGLGYPPGYDGKENTTARDTPNELRLVRRETLFDIAQSANEKRQVEVKLNEDTQRRLRTWIPNHQSAPISLEINVFVAAASMRDLDERRFSVIVGPNVGAIECGRSLGRFAVPLGPIGTDAFRHVAQRCEAVRPEEHFVELSYLPMRLKLTNVMVRPPCRRYEIDYGVQPGVPLADAIVIDQLLVGLRNGRFYVRSPTLPGDLRVCSGHMANPQFAPPICRFLTEASFDSSAMLREFDWGMASMFHFLPRVRVGNVVLSVARWRISAQMAGDRFSATSAEAFRRSLALWRTEWNVPRHVHLAQADNRLALDLENEMDIEDLRLELCQLTKSQAVLLEEIYPALEDVWLRGSNGGFMAEYVVPLVLNIDSRPVRRDSPTATPRSMAGASAARASCRLKAPGSDWLYVKLYCAPSIEDDLLKGPIRQLTRWAYQSGIVDRWFFVRYADPDPHIRLRFQGAHAQLFESLHPKISRWAQSLMDSDLCLRFCVDTYEREIERYGGDYAMESAERLFCADSESALEMLSFLGPESPLQRIELAVFGLDFLFRKLGCSAPERLALVEDMAAPRLLSGIEYRQRKAVLQAMFGIRHEPRLAKTIGGVLIALEKNAPAIAEVGRQLVELESEGNLSRPLDSIFRGFAHMACNRMGLDAASEKKAYGLLVRSYDTLHALSAPPQVDLLTQGENAEEINA
jgi:thiopeptide-type bacteriocin biosynthesis protein